MEQNLETPKSSEIATSTPNLPTTGQALAAFGAYADEVSKGSRQILKFKKGKFCLGKDGDELPLGKNLVANVLSLSREWLKWRDGEVIERVVARVAAGEKLPERETLGDLDQTFWEKDPNGTPLDPWQESHSIVFKDMETGEEYRFATASFGSGLRSAITS